MPLVFFKSTDQADIYVWKISEKLSYFHSNFADFSQINNIQKAAVRAILYLYAGENASIVYNKDGSPVLLGSEKYKYITVSHTNRYVAVIFSKRVKFGVDIEFIGRGFSRVSSRFLSINERVQISNSPIKLFNFVDFMALIWSSKEAMYKLIDSPSYSFTDFYHVVIPIYPFNNRFKALYGDKSLCEYKELDLEYCLIQDHILVWVSY